MDITYHLVPQAYFDSLDPRVDYTPRDFGREGFIHCTDGAAEMARTANRYYQSDRDAYYYLYLDKARVRAEIRYEDPRRVYPHIYGALNRDAIIAIRPARRDADGSFLPPEPIERHGVAFGLQKTWQGIAGTIAKTKRVRVFFVLLLIGYVALGIRTHLSFQAPLMQDLDTYLNAYMQASKGIDPYAHSNILTAYLYPLPGLLVVGPFSTLPEGYLRAGGFIAVNLLLLAFMLRGIAGRYGYRLKDIWWWFPLAFGFAPLFELLHMGQINLITSFGVYLMFAYSLVLPALAGFGLTVAIVTKLIPAIFLFYLAIQKRYLELAWGVTFLVGAYVLSYALFGWQDPSTYLEVVTNQAGRWSGSDSGALVSILYSQGWIEAGAWTNFQRVLLGWMAIIFASSGISALVSKRWEPLFIILSIGSFVASNVMWYHYYVFLLLPYFVWVAWSRFHPAVIAWCFVGLTLIQVDNGYLTEGLLSHLFVHLSMLGILIWQLTQVMRTKSYARIIIGAGAIPAILVVGWFLYDALDSNANLTNARRWIDANLPAGAVVAVESYGPTVGRQYSGGDFQDLLAHSPDWYEKNGWEFIITGYGTHSGSNIIPILQSSSTKRYDDFLSQFSLVRRLAETRHAIGIYKTGATGPAQRVSARWGFLGGEWLDLVGYDSSGSTLQAAEPATLTFYWRTVERRRNPLQLTARLLDRSDREVAISVGALFGTTDSSERWPEGITRVPWKIVVPAPAAPGLYRVQLEVDAEGLGRMPVLPYADQALSDKLYLGPFKLSPPPLSPDESSRARAVNARFAEVFSLRSYSINPGSGRPGETLKVKLDWESVAKTDKDYTIFLHLVDAGGNIRAQVDTQPFNGTYPTSLWDAGEVMRDEYELLLPRDLVSGDYWIEVGLYEYPSLARLPVVDARGENRGDHLILDDMIKMGASRP